MSIITTLDIRRDRLSELPGEFRSSKRGEAYYFSNLRDLFGIEVYRGAFLVNGLQIESDDLPRLLSMLDTGSVWYCISEARFRYFFPTHCRSFRTNTVGQTIIDEIEYRLGRQ